MNTNVKHVLTNNQATHELIQQMKDKIPYTDIKWVSEENSDLWVLDIFNQKRNGTFVDCGAAGRSNSWNLEKFYDWNGVCVEPNYESYLTMTDINFLDLFQGLRKNVINKCLYSHNEIVDFYECTGEILEKHSITSINNPWNSAHLSTVVGHQRSHDDEYVKKYGKIVKKQCITLENIIIENNLPNTIDYLSIDIENCEEEVFRVFPWDKYIFKTISLEEGHKHAAFLKSKGYQMVDNPYQVYKPWIDYFFVHESMIESYPYKILDHNDFIYGYPLDDDRYY